MRGEATAGRRREARCGAGKRRAARPQLEEPAGRGRSEGGGCDAAGLGGAPRWSTRAGRVGGRGAASGGPARDGVRGRAGPRGEEAAAVCGRGGEVEREAVASPCGAGVGAMGLTEVGDAAVAMDTVMEVALFRHIMLTSGWKVMRWLFF